MCGMCYTTIKSSIYLVSASMHPGSYIFTIGQRHPKSLVDNGGRRGGTLLRAALALLLLTHLGVVLDTGICRGDQR